MGKEDVPEGLGTYEEGVEKVSEIAAFFKNGKANWW
jgi:hypothetical protein